MNASAVFAIAEVARVICRSLEDDRMSLLSLVYCNRAISETALDTLWAKMDSLKPFLQFVPEEIRDACWDLDIGTESFLQMTCPSIEKWKTFDKYAHRVKELYSADPSAAWMDAQRLIYPRLMALRARTGVDLFPNLQSITCCLSDSCTRGEKLLPLGLRSLTSFTCQFMIQGQDYWNTLLQPSSHAPLLEHLCLRGFFRFGSANLTQPLQLKYLRTVDLTRASLSSCDFRFLYHALCECPVEELSVHMRDPLPDEWQPVFPVFPELRYLVYCGTPEIALQFLARLSSTTLSQFTIEHEDRIARLDSYKALLGLLHERFADSLRSLHLNLSGSHGTDVHRYYFLAQTLMALKPLADAGLEELQYSMTIIVSTLPDELQHALDPSFEFWSQLRKFTFSTRSKKLSDRQYEETMKLWGPIFGNTGVGFQRIEYGTGEPRAEQGDQVSFGYMQ